jgi:hypothetical protein
MRKLLPLLFVWVPYHSPSKVTQGLFGLGASGPEGLESKHHSFILLINNNCSPPPSIVQLLDLMMGTQPVYCEVETGFLNQVR